MSGDGPSGNQADKDKQDALYEDREPKKIIRIITVTAYMVSVSFVGIVLSAYYIFLWHPPNPRLMHAQAIQSHSERQVGEVLAHQQLQLNDHGLGGASSSGEGAGLVNLQSRMAFDERPIDVFAAEARMHSPESESLKTRREIVKNVNAILRASFEKTRASSESSDADQREFTSTLAPDNITESSASVGESSSTSSSSTYQTERTSSSSSSSTEESSPSTTATSTTRRTSSSSRSPEKKPHQTPFALKHLEVPIKSDGSRKRPLRVITATPAPTTSPRFSSYIKGTSPDRTTPLESLTTISPQRASNAGDTSSPQQLLKKSLFQTLTTPQSHRDSDYPSSTDLPASLLMPSISSDQFQAMPRSSSNDNNDNNNDDEYHDSTIRPVMDDLMDD